MRIMENAPVIQKARTNVVALPANALISARKVAQYGWLPKTKNLGYD